MSGRRLWRHHARRLLLILAIVLPGAVPASSAHAARPTLILAPGSGMYGPGCAGRMMALGDGFPEGAGVALFALKSPDAPFTLENIRTLLATVVVQEGRFVNGYVGLDSLLCAERGGNPAAYPDGAAIDIVAATGTDVSEPFPRAGTELTRATFTVDRGRAIPASQRCFAETLLCVQGRFHDYWLANGGLARNDLPLTPERVELLEDGREYTVQYFERVRLESHPEYAPPYDMLLGQFGHRILAGVLGAPTAPAPPVPGATFFPETGHNVGPRFAAYWRDNGGLAQFGYPLTEAFEQQLEDGNVYTVQYFERARFEHHPEHAPPFDVLLAQYGRRILAEGAPNGIALGPPTAVRGSGFAPGAATRYTVRRDRDGSVTASNSAAGCLTANAGGTYTNTIQILGCDPGEHAGTTFTITVVEYRPDRAPTDRPSASASFTMTR